MKNLLLLSTVFLSSCTITKTIWTDSIKNKENAEFITEVAFNLNKPVKKVTQKEFNARYLTNKQKTN